MIIKVKNSMSQATNITSEDVRQLKKLLSYKVNNYFVKYDTTRYLIDSKGFFPTGLLYLVKQKFPNAVIEEHRVKPISKPGMFKLEL